MSDAVSSNPTVAVSADATVKGRALETLLASVRTLIGETKFDAASAEQTLRPRATALLAPETTPTLLTPSSDTARTIANAASAALGSGAPSPSISVASSPDGLARASDYTLLNRVGKGGMGEVFLAGQNALRREVAVKKIIPEHLDRRAVKEIEDAFVSEALVTGYLGHPNIVPVHALGRDDSGNWFFSMKMVRGIEWRHVLHPDHCRDAATKEKALARNLGVDDPALRAAHLEENLGILLAVCNAVAFAHSKQIIHRDLKPENVMVGEFGEVLVMDWGLAVDVSETPPAPGSLEHRVSTRAQSGFGGTPAYMAPEQFAFDQSGKSTGDYLGRWTDVFLLGAMLYEVLTGDAPYSGLTLKDTLKHVADCNPRSLPENVPAELAAICRQALAKNPHERFPDALAFQKAVQNFLTHREASVIAAKAEQEAKVLEIPNLARAVVLYDQALELWPENRSMGQSMLAARAVLLVKEQQARWTRRSLYAAVASIVVGLATGFFWIRSDQQRLVLEKERADSNEKAAVAARNVAESKSAELAEALKISGQRGDLLTSTLDKQIVEIQDELDKYPGLQEVKKNLLINAAEGYKQALTLLPNSVYAETQTLIAFQKLGDIYVNIGDSAHALDSFQKAQDVGERLLAKTPDDANIQRNVSVILGRIASVLRAQGNTAEALKVATKRLAIVEKLASQSLPPPRRIQIDLAWTFSQIADIRLTQGDAALALTFYKRGILILEQVAADQPENLLSQRDLTYAYDRIGDLYLKRGDLKNALESFSKALAIRESLANKLPDDAESRNSMAVSHERIGDVRSKMFDYAQALKEHTQALKLREELLTIDPRNAQYQRNISVSYERLGDVHMNLNETAEALDAFEKHLALSETLAAADKKSAVAQNDLAWALHKMGDVRLRQNDVQAALEVYKKSLVIFEKLAKDDPLSAQARRDLAFTYDSFGEANMKAEYTAAALVSFKKALENRQKLVQSDPESAAAQAEEALAYIRVGWVYVNIKEFNQGIDWIGKGLASLRKLDKTGMLPESQRSSLTLAQQALDVIKKSSAEERAAQKK